LIRAKKASAEWRIRHKLTQSRQPPNTSASAPNPKKTFWVEWTKPPQRFIKINYDGSKSQHQASGGYVIRNWIGQLIQVGAFNLGAASILVAKATAMRNGLRDVVVAGFNNIFIEGDNKVLIKAIQGHIQPP